VSNGAASATFVLPGGTAVGTYTINASYTDSANNFANSADTTHTLTVSAATTTTTASNATIAFSTSNQTVTLTATVTSAGGTVNDGNVQFSITDSLGNVIGTATAGNVTNGSASVSYVIPAGTAPGTYTINAVYHPGTSSNFSGSADNTHVLTVTTSSSTSVSITKVNIAPNFTSTNAPVTVTVQVNNPGGTVNEGFVSVTIAGVSGTANVSNGTATVQLVIPLQAAMTWANVTFSYTDNASSPAFANGSGSTTLYLNIANALLPSIVQFASDGTQFNQIPMGNQTLFAFAYSMIGLLTQINTGSITFPVTYSHVGNMIFSAIGGLPWQVLFLNSSGQLTGLAQIQLASDGTAQWVFYSPNGQIIGTMPL
jgi:hypothetical protein